MLESIDSDETESRVDTTWFPEVPGTQLLARGIHLIFALREAHAPMSTTELAAILDLPVSNTYRMVQQLELAGLIERAPNGDLVLGFRLLDLGRSTQERVDRELAPLALSTMQSLTNATGETTLLTVVAGVHAICVLTIPSRRPIRLAFEPGRIMPMYRAASGRVLLAWLKPRMIDQVLADLKPYTNENGYAVSADTLRPLLEGIRTDGFCITRSETDQDATGIAAPVFSTGDRLVGGLTLAGPTDRFSETRMPALVDAVRAAASEISARCSVAQERPEIRWVP
jgi:DNA-binding IclR family transcriptional regulator